MVETTKQEREDVRQLFGYVLKTLKPGFGSRDGFHTQITQVTSDNKYAHIRRASKSKVVLGINFEHWRNYSIEERIRTLLHEVSHIEHSNHKREFWREYLNNYEEIQERQQIGESLEEVVGENINWDKVARHIVEDVNSGNIDQRQMDVSQKRKAVAHNLGVELNNDTQKLRQLALDEKLVISEDWEVDRTDIKPKEAEFDRVGRDKLLDWIENYWNEDLQKYEFPLPKVREEDGRYIPVDKDSEKIIEMTSYLYEQLPVNLTKD